MNLVVVDFLRYFKLQLKNLPHYMKCVRNISLLEFYLFSKNNNLFYIFHFVNHIKILKT